MNWLETTWDRYRKLDQRNPYVSPSLATIVFLIFLALDLRIEPTPESGFKQESVLGGFLAVAQVLPLVFVRRAPLAVLTVIGSAFVAHAALDYDTVWVVQLTTIIGLYVVTSTTDDRQSMIGGLIIFAIVIAVFGFIHEETDNAIVINILFAGVWIAGSVVRSRRTRLEIAELTVSELSDEQVRVRREAAQFERARIARELHDVVGHTLNLVVIQAGAAQKIFTASPDKAFETLKSIESTGRQALSDVDRMLGILQDPEDTEDMQDSVKALEGRPSMSRVNSLIEEVRAAGQAVEMEMAGTPISLAPSVDLSAYRVMQEALTNVMTHAAGSYAVAKISYSENLIALTVLNDGSGNDRNSGRTSGGRGMVGMRERVAMFNGKFEAGQTDDGGWRVFATFPINSTGSAGV